MVSAVESKSIIGHSVTACAHPNLALVKYWGQRNAALNLPANASLSVNLSAATTTTKVTFIADLQTDVVSLNGALTDQVTSQRVSQHLDRIRELAGISLYAQVVSTNDFPTAAGMASSAAAYAALSLAGTRAAGLSLGERELSILARKGSGSAARSIPDGFCVWYTGDNDVDSFAESLVPCGYWDVNITSVAFASHTKEISSLHGHRAASSSPYYETRLHGMAVVFDEARRALLDRDLSRLGMLVEREAISFHAIAMTSRVAGKPWLSGIYYWLPQTLMVMQAVQSWRQQGLQVYFTLDAGATVHLLYEAEDHLPVVSHLASLAAQVEMTWLTSQPGRGAWLVDEKSGAEAPLDRSCPG